MMGGITLYLLFFVIFGKDFCAMKPFVFVFFFLLYFLPGKSFYTEKLNFAEAVMNQKPDSALIILREIDPQTIQSSKETARYALLMSQALDKNYIDVTSDSLINKAVNYYSRHKNNTYRMLSHYYHGLVLKNAREYSSAIIALENAERDGIMLQDYHYLGLIYRNKSDVFNLTNNHREAIECMKTAIHFFELANEPVYKAYATFSLSVVHLNNKDYMQADSLLNDLVQNTTDANLLHSCHLRQASILAMNSQNPEKALFYYRQVPRRYYQILDCAYYALSHEKIGNRDSSDYWMKEGYVRCRNHADSATIDFVKSKIELRRNHFQEAFKLVNHATYVQDSLVRILLQQSVSVAQRDYYKSEAALQKERMIATKRTWTLLCTIAVLILAMVFAGIIWRSREKDRLLKDQMAHLAINNQTLEKVYKENALLLGSLFSSRIAHLDTLNERYYRLEEGKEKDAVFKEIKDCVASMRKNPEIYHSLEKDLDRYCDGVMTKLRAQVPRIKGENLKIIMLFFAGISDDVVHLLLNTTSAQSLRMTRSRFRKEILSAQAPDSELFLNMLMKKKTATEH